MQFRDFRIESHNHWQYSKDTAKICGAPLEEEMWRICEFFYVAAMVHGYKHGLNDSGFDAIDLVTIKRWVDMMESLCDNEGSKNSKTIAKMKIHIRCTLDYMLTIEEKILAKSAMMVAEEDSERM